MGLFWMFVVVRNFGMAYVGQLGLEVSFVKDHNLFLLSFVYFVILDILLSRSLQCIVFMHM